MPRCVVAEQQDQCNRDEQARDDPIPDVNPNFAQQVAQLKEKSAANSSVGDDASGLSAAGQRAVAGGAGARTPAKLTRRPALAQSAFARPISGADHSTSLISPKSFVTQTIFPHCTAEVEDTEAHPAGRPVCQLASLPTPEGAASLFRPLMTLR